MRAQKAMLEGAAQSAGLVIGALAAVLRGDYRNAYALASRLAVVDWDVHLATAPSTSSIGVMTC